MPARKNPVKNRNTQRVKTSFANQMINKLNSAAIREQTKNKWVLLKRSATVKKANTKVPAIKPACIIDVTSAMLTGVENNLAKSSRTALPKNQSEVPAN